MARVTSQGCLGEMFQKGTIIWRPCFLTGKRFKPSICNSNSLFLKTGKGWATKVAIGGEQYIWEPEVRSVSIANGTPVRGLIVFVSTDPVPHWTHLVVTGTSRAMNEPGLRNKGAALFAEVAAPYAMRDYLEFRHRLGKAVIAKELIFGEERESSRSINDMVDVSNEFWPGEECRSGQTRLICCEHDGYIDYESIYDEVEEEDTLQDEVDRSLEEAIL